MTLHSPFCRVHRSVSQVKLERARYASGRVAAVRLGADLVKGAVKFIGREPIGLEENRGVACG